MVHTHPFNQRLSKEDGMGKVLAVIGCQGDVREGKNPLRDQVTEKTPKIPDSNFMGALNTWPVYSKIITVVC